MNPGPAFYGKYRGIVSDNRDPLMLGRIRVRVQDVLGDRESGWALPSLPYAGNGVGLFLLPPTNALVWVEFEQGDPDYPIWTGCFWGAPSELPALPATPEMKVLKTETATVTLNDLIGSITIETQTGMTLELTPTGITINAGVGTIAITGSRVSINNGALEVT
jgi:uncharacterized protein involved in type VI secretion and phage assembly